MYTQALNTADTTPRVPAASIEDAERMAHFQARIDAEDRIGFIEQFRISRAESGFPVFQSVLELENDRQSAEKRLAAIPNADQLRGEMAEFSLESSLRA